MNKRECCAYCGTVVSVASFVLCMLRVQCLLQVLCFACWEYCVCCEYCVVYVASVVHVALGPGSCRGLCLIA